MRIAIGGTNPGARRHHTGWPVSSHVRVILTLPCVARRARSRSSGARSPTPLPPTPIPPLCPPDRLRGRFPRAEVHRRGFMRGRRTTKAAVPMAESLRITEQRGQTVGVSPDGRACTGEWRTSLRNRVSARALDRVSGLLLSSRNRTRRTSRTGFQPFPEHKKGGAPRRAPRIHLRTSVTRPEHSSVRSRLSGPEPCGLP